MPFRFMSFKASAFSSPHDFIACWLGPGDSFGELALAPGNPRGRAATVTATRQAPLLLVAIEGHDYRRMIERSQSLEVAERAALLGGTRWFKDCSPEQLQAVASVAQPRTLRPGAVVFSQGQPPDYMYAVRKGELKVIVSTGSVR